MPVKLNLDLAVLESYHKGDHYLVISSTNFDEVDILPAIEGFTLDDVIKPKGYQVAGFFGHVNEPGVWAILLVKNNISLENLAKALNTRAAQFYFPYVEDEQRLFVPQTDLIHYDPDKETLTIFTVVPSYWNGWRQEVLKSLGVTITSYSDRNPIQIPL